jgi:tyrosyl-tRNA synthetase
MDITQQLALLKRGATDIKPEDGLLEKLKKAEKTGKPLRIKLGLDPTAPDIHLGSSVVLRKLRQFQDLGHEVTVVIGDFTAMIGDPSGRSETRKQLSRADVDANARTYADQYCRILDASRTSVRFNSEWLGALNFHEVIMLAGRTTVAQIMERDDFARRFRENQTIGLHELMYPLCQAYDSVVLESDVEMGGSDQMFNIMTGRALQGQYGQDTQIGLFMPLLVGLDGVQKMSKSLGNYIGITEPANTMFGKVMSIPDRLLRDYFILTTDVPDAEVEALVTGAEQGTANPRDVKRRLAREIVTIYHDASAAEGADEEFRRVYSEKQRPQEIPTKPLPAEAGEKGAIWVCRLLVALGLASGTGEARRLVQQGGVQIEDRKITDPAEEIAVADLLGAVVRVGSRRFVKVEGG